jgi:Rad3-related DNA helicase
MEKKNQKNQSKISLKDFLAIFHGAHSDARPNQLVVLKEFPNEDKILLQGPTGTGKTALVYTFLKGHCGKQGNGFYVCPSKTLVDQVVKLYPEIIPMYGRNEYPCLYYNSEYKADEIPCSILKECPHRINLETGKIFQLGAKPCPYLRAKFKSRQASLVACTTNYYFFEALSHTREKLPDAIGIDEVHEFSNSIRRMLSYKITDWRLDQFWELLSSIECRSEAKLIMIFKEEMIRIIKEHLNHGTRTTLLKDESLKQLLKTLLKLERSNIDLKIKQAIESKKIDPKDDRELLREFDVFTNDLYRYIHSLEFALETKNRKPLGYVFGYWDRKDEPGKKAEYTLTIQSYRIAGLVKQKLLPEKYLACSATIGAESQMLTIDTGIDGKFIDLTSEFPIENTRIFMPDDMSDLSVKGSRHNDKNRTLRQILLGCKKGKEQKIRSLVIVVSEVEREKCCKFAKEADLDAVSYSNGIKPKEAVRSFREGKGDILIGTEAQYGQGIDLPDGICGFIFYLRPGYPTPDDPQAQFEEKIYGNTRWSLWTWRVILKMLQARGRNQRSAQDKGCIFLMSKQFQRFTYGGLPEWLRPAYAGQISFEESIKQGIKLLKNSFILSS